MPTTWTKINKPTTSWTGVAKPPGYVQTKGSPIGLLLVLTYSSSFGTSWTKISKATTNWTTVPKAT